MLNNGFWLGCNGKQLTFCSIAAAYKTVTQHVLVLHGSTGESDVPVLHGSTGESDVPVLHGSTGETALGLN